MCDECHQHDRTIERSRRIITAFIDPATLTAAKKMLEEDLRKKRLFHPER
jgi:hypothetical protein